jgi:hypothetical protein
LVFRKPRHEGSIGRLAIKESSHHALAVLVGLAAPDRHEQAVRSFGDVGPVEGDQL